MGKRKRDRQPQMWVAVTDLPNVLKRLLVHASAFKLGLWMRTLFGIGTLRALQGRLAAFATVFAESWNLTLDAIGRRWRQNVPLTPARRSMNEHLACS
jgi:hypothetical protein